MPVLHTPACWFHARQPAPNDAWRRVLRAASKLLPGPMPVHNGHPQHFHRQQRCIGTLGAQSGGTISSQPGGAGHVGRKPPRMIANDSEICKDGFRNSRGIQTIQTALVPCAAGRESALRAVSLAQKALRGLNLELGRPAGRKGPPFTSPRCHRGVCTYAPPARYSSRTTLGMGRVTGLEGPVCQPLNDHSIQTID